LVPGLCTYLSSSSNSVLYGGKVAGLNCIRFAAEALLRKIVTAHTGNVKMQGQINHYFSFQGRFRYLPPKKLESIDHIQKWSTEIWVPSPVQNLWIFANWYAELNFLCLATFTPVSAQWGPKTIYPQKLIDHTNEHLYWYRKSDLNINLLAQKTCQVRFSYLLWNGGCVRARGHWKSCRRSHSARR